MEFELNGPASSNYEIFVSCRIRDARGGTLLIKNIDEQSGNTWGLPSGYMEKGESLTVTIERSMHEEVGVDVERYSISGLTQWYNNINRERYIVFLIDVVQWKESDRQPARGAEREFFTDKEMKDLSMGEGFAFQKTIFDDKNINEAFGVWNVHGVSKEMALTGK